MGVVIGQKLGCEVQWTNLLLQILVVVTAKPSGNLGDRMGKGFPAMRHQPGVSRS
jgi:hypothetical protein